MYLYLVRHGPAALRDPRRWQNDGGRPLSPEGARTTRAAAKAFAREAGPITRIASSPARRAARTAEILAGVLPGNLKVEVWPELDMGQPADGVLQRVALTWRDSDGGVVVGHAPGLTELIGLALTGESLPVAHLTKAGACAIEFPRRIAPGAGRLDWLLTRKQWLAQVK
jgi:phosphohistidine phosphatase SixA